MLTTLRLRDFAIIDELSLELGPGMNVLTGETGAGKSIIVDAVHLLLGGRARTDVIRGGADEAVVEAMFEPGEGTRAALRALDLDGDEGLVVRRVVSRSGKNRITLNGSPATLAMLEQVAGGLIDVTGQHEHHSLLAAENHQALLDAYGGTDPLRAAVAAAHAHTRALHEERAALERDDRERAAREDFIRFQLNEIREAAFEADEDEALQRERGRLRSVGRLLAATQGGEEALYGADESAAVLVARVERELSELRALDPDLGVLADRLTSARVELEDVARGLTDYARTLAADPDRLAEVEDRLALAQRLKRKHGGTLDDVLATGERLAAELERLTGSGERLAALAGELDAAEQALGKAAAALTRARRAAAMRMQSAVAGELKSLALGGAGFEVSVQPRGPAGQDGELSIGTAHITARGADRVEFLFAPNVGEEKRPLRRIASGGELSRVTLALKAVLAARDPVDTYVFDEVDSGVGGAVGEVLGRKIRQVSQSRQVICVTHLAQIAACADEHFIVEKRALAGRTVSQVRPLDEVARLEEVARMLGGLKITPKTRAHAEEMLRAAK